MPKNLLIVESPAKAKTIEKFLGKDFSVKSSFGHVRDLPKSNISVEVENNFKPKYIISPEKKKVVKELKTHLKKADEVWLATDEDREGEAISWHLCKVLGLDVKNTKRIVFREITKPAIQKAVQNPRTVNLDLVDAQQARRVLDRLVGYELSELLWKKVKGNLSAGRVQSVSVKLVVEREREILNFKEDTFFKVKGIFNVKNVAGKIVELIAEMPGKMEKEADAEAFLNKCIGSSYSISNIEVKPVKRKPSPPFTTSTLQQEASRKLYFPVKKTMMVAQKLYEQGFITYMRTDSISLSETAISAIATEIEKSFGKQYLQTRRFKSKKALAQEAHEAIRPTYVDRSNLGATNDQQRLYELIRKRTLASQMSDAILEKTIAKISISKVQDVVLRAEGEVLKFDGFLKVYIASKDEEQEAKGMLPPLRVGQELDLKELLARQRFTKPPSRYTEAGLVRKLEELGIGRPSTYAPTITKIMSEDRGYIKKESKEGVDRKFQVFSLSNGKVDKRQDVEKKGGFQNRLVPLDLGFVVTDFLTDNFKDIMNYDFTANVEKQFDDIAEGKMVWYKMLEDFYSPFHKLVTETLEKAGKASGEKILGTDAETGKTVLVRIARFGPVVQIGKQDELGENEKPKYANLPAGYSIESITFEEAMDLFSLPKTLGNYEDKEVIIGAGRFGPYVKFDGKFVSIPRNEDPLTIAMPRAIELIEEKRNADKPVGTYKNIPYTKGKGRFGPFLKWNNMYVNVPRKYDFDNLTLEEAAELIEKKIEKEANRYIHNWKEEKISVENGRWGPFIRFGRKNIKIPKVDGEKVTSEKAKDFTLEQVKKMIEAEIPDAFKKKTRKKKK